jgi:hypothetical protein
MAERPRDGGGEVDSESANAVGDLFGVGRVRQQLRHAAGERLVSTGTVDQIASPVAHDEDIETAGSSSHARSSRMTPTLTIVRATPRSSRPR